MVQVTSLASILTAIVLMAGQATSLVDEFRSAAGFGKRRLLGKRPASDEEIRNLLVAAIKDADVGVRTEAVGSIGTILTMSSMPNVPQGQEWTARLRAVGEALRPELDAAINDPEPRVRMEALRGIVGPIVGPFSSKGTTLPKPLVIKLAAMFERDPSSQIRTATMQAVAAQHGSGDPEVRRLASQVLLRGLEDSNPYVVQYAGLQAAQSKIPEALPLLVEQLKNPAFVARMGVAQGIAAYREAARKYLPELQTALAAETHDITRKTIAGTISVISK
jgi:hypothetical protein